MGHNYAKPLTPGMRIEHILKRIPPAWSITLTRSSQTHKWQANMTPPEETGQASDEFDDPADALQEAWQRNRKPK